MNPDATTETRTESSTSGGGRRAAEPCAVALAIHEAPAEPKAGWLTRAINWCKRRVLRVLLPWWW